MGILLFRYFYLLYKKVTHECKKNLIDATVLEQIITRIRELFPLS